MGFAWVVVLAFLRLSTRPDLFPAPLTQDAAFDVARGWLDAPAAVEIHPTARHLDILRGLLAPIGTAANLVNDAHLAALAVEHGATLVSFDRDFGRFPGVRWEQPPG
jgi:toxin-antitoxin system PIN domain toxin